MTNRDTYKYHCVVGGVVVHQSVTHDRRWREREHQQRWPNGNIIQIGRRTTRAAALAWERRGGEGK